MNKVMSPVTELFLTILVFLAIKLFRHSNYYIILNYDFFSCPDYCRNNAECQLDLKQIALKRRLYLCVLARK